MTQPLLVIVGGAPATGKTTLARELARRLHLAILTKDDIKESLADALGSGDRTRSRELGRAAYRVLFDVTARTLEAGTGVVLEANFYRDDSADELRRLARLGEAVIVLCRSDAATRRARFETRRDRHPVHLDREVLAHEWADDDAKFALDLGVPRREVDTTRAADVDLDAIVAWISSEVSSRTSVRRPVD